ncbi:MAG: heavy-metal-associated domain-containing protein [Proteobacteria bacterium]|nr:MAG: heavy-metal-associated domain-containing protein [Pseudomonadota bacterium]
MNTPKATLIAALIFLPHFATAKPITVQVKGMVCAFCAQGIEKKLKALPDVNTVKVSLESKKVEIDTKLEKDISDDQLSKIITDAGYGVVKIERTK